MVVNGWLKGVSGIIFVGPRKWPKTFVFAVFRGVLGTKKAAFGRPRVQLVTFGYNSTHIQL